MKILLGIHQFFPDFYTGTERYVLNLAKQFQRMGHYVKVLTYDFKNQEGFRHGHSKEVLRKEYFYEGVPVVAIRHKKLPDNIHFVLDLLDKDIYGEARDIFEKNNFDIYHFAHPIRIAPVVKAASDLGVKTVFMVTDYWLMCPRGIMLRLDNTICDSPDNGRNCLKYCFTEVGEGQMQKRISDAQKLLEYCDCLLSPSRFLIRLFNATGFIPPDRFILSRHGFDYAKKRKYFFRKPGELIRFGYIGTLQYHKGVHVMVEGFKKTTNHDVKLQIWGECFHEEEYQKNVLKMTEGDSRIEFKGAYNFNDMETVLEDIDVVIVPSIWYENAPLTIMTSLAHGIP
ncbi:MAG: glycosyltransferase, partial [Thermodesulfobacteriota bacterium]